MNPNEVVISPPGTGSTVEEITADCEATRLELKRVFTFLDPLCEEYKACEEGPAKDALWEQFLDLDEKRCHLDDHLAAQLARLRNEF